MVCLQLIALHQEPAAFEHDQSSSPAAAQLLITAVLQPVEPARGVKRKSLFPPGPVPSKAKLSWELPATRRSQQQHVSASSSAPGSEQELAGADDSSSELSSSLAADDSSSSSDDESIADASSSDWELQAAHCFRDMRLEFMHPRSAGVSQAPVAVVT